MSTSSARRTRPGRRRCTSPATPERVVLLVRGDCLEKSMSQYLVERIHAAENIEVRLQTEIVCGGGNDHLEWLTLVDRATGSKRR